MPDSDEACRDFQAMAGEVYLEQVRIRRSKCPVCPVSFGRDPATDFRPHTSAEVDLQMLSSKELTSTPTQMLC